MATKQISTEDVKPNQPADIILKDGSLARGGAQIETASEAINKDYLDALAFMEEEITVMVMETTDENAENPVTVGCNGVFVQFFRGEPRRVRRKFVDSLIVKTSRTTTPKVRNNAGEDVFAIRQTSAHKFPFTIVEDRNPKGSEWLKQRLTDGM